MMSLLKTTTLNVNKQSQAAQTQNDKNGNGKQRGLRNRKRQQKSNKSQGRFRYLRNTDLTMKFNTAQDPIYFAFDAIENRSLSELMVDFVQDSFYQVANFVSKVTK